MFGFRKLGPARELEKQCHQFFHGPRFDHGKEIFPPLHHLVECCTLKVEGQSGG